MSCKFLIQTMKVKQGLMIAAVLLAIAVLVYSRYQDKEIVAFIDDWNAKQKAGK